jgi:hypothetical protein
MRFFFDHRRTLSVFDPPKVRLALSKEDDPAVVPLAIMISPVLPMATGWLQTSMDCEVIREEQSNAASNPARRTTHRPR